jgi:palmitoyl-protein thioesterase
MVLLTSFNNINNKTSVQACPIYNDIDNSDVIINININNNINNNIPVVVLHGIASSSEKMVDFSEWVSKTFNRTVFNLEIGNGERTSIYTPMPDQLSQLCNTIYDIAELREGFDFIGMSQGGLLARGYVEYCNKYSVFNLITLVSPHGGVKNDVTLDMYSDFLQEHLSLAGYWRDPTQLTVYLDKCVYLPQLNNEHISSSSFVQKENIKSLMNFVMIWSSEDTTVTPAESAKFSFYDEDYNIVDIRDTDLYQLDLLGLKYLDDNNSFHIHETNCSHVEHRDPVCYGQMYEILRLYL